MGVGVCMVRDVGYCADVCVIMMSGLVLSRYIRWFCVLRRWVLLFV